MSNTGWLTLVSPEYLLNITIWKTFWPLPLTAAVLSGLVYLAGTRRGPFRERSGIFGVLLAFSALGLITGVIGGNSREPAVGAVLPAVLSLVGALAIYLIGKNIQQRVLVGLSVFCLSITLALGFFWGSIIRVRAEDYWGVVGRQDPTKQPLAYPDSILVHVSDASVAIKFYTESLGLKKVTDQANPDGERWVEVVPEGAQTKILLHSVAPSNKEIKIGGPTGISFFTRDIWKSSKALENRGVRFVRGPFPYGKYSRATFSDPDGNTYELVEYNLFNIN